MRFKTMRFKISFLKGQLEIATIEGAHDVDTDHLTVADLDRVVLTEQLLERLLGLRVHIEQLHVGEAVQS